MGRITPELMDELFDEDVLDLLPADRNIRLGVANFNKAQDPEWQKKHNAAMKQKGQDPVFRAKMKKAAHDRANDPEWVETMKRVKSTEDQRENMRKRQSARMGDVGLRDRTAAAVSQTKQADRADVHRQMVAIVQSIGLVEEIQLTGLVTKHDIVVYCIRKFKPFMDSQQIMFVIMTVLSIDNERTVRSMMSRANKKV